MATPTTYTGEDAVIWLYANTSGMTHGTLAISDVGLTISRGTAEQSLVGEKGNFYLAGSRSIEGSLTSCKLHSNAVGNIVSDMIAGSSIRISGNCGANSLRFYFKSCQVTGFDFSIGTADEITEGSLDFALLYPYKVSSVVSDGPSGVATNSVIRDWGA